MLGASVDGLEYHRVVLVVRPHLVAEQAAGADLHQHGIDRFAGDGQITHAPGVHPKRLFRGTLAGVYVQDSGVNNHVGLYGNYVLGDSDSVRNVQVEPGRRGRPPASGGQESGAYVGCEHAVTTGNEGRL